MYTHAHLRVRHSLLLIPALCPLVPVQPIETRAENQQLKHLIEQFVSERARLESGEVHDLSQLFQPKGGTGGDGGRGAGMQHAEEEKGIDVFRTSIYSCVMQK